MVKKSVIIILIIEILITGMACHSYSTARLGIGDTNDNLDKVRITTFDDKVIILNKARIDDEHIKGLGYLSQSETLAGKQKNEIAIPLKDIKKLELRRYDGTTTAYVFLGIGAVLLTLLVIGSASMSGGVGM